MESWKTSISQFFPLSKLILQPATKQPNMSDGIEVKLEECYSLCRVRSYDGVLDMKTRVSVLQELTQPYRTMSNQTHL